MKYFGHIAFQRLIGNRGVAWECWLNEMQTFHGNIRQGITECRGTLFKLISVLMAAQRKLLPTITTILHAVTLFQAMAKPHSAEEMQLPLVSIA